MAFTIKDKVNKIRQVVRLKQVMHRWKSMSLSGDGQVRIPSGFMGVYVGVERCRFVIPTRYLKLPVLVSLLEKAEEEYGFQSEGGLVLPCQVEFFQRVMDLLERDEVRYGAIGLEDFLQLLPSSIFQSRGEWDTTKEAAAATGFTPLLLHHKPAYCS